MRSTQYRHWAHQVQARTITLLQLVLRPRDFSARCSAWQLLSSLLVATGHCLSLAAVAALRPGSPSRETLRQAWLATLPAYQQLLRQLPRLLRASLPRGLRRRPRRRYPLAIDLHAVPYYKRDRTPPTPVRKGKRLPGTSYSHQYATACLLRKGEYYTVALTPYFPDETLAAVVRRLLRQAAGIGFTPRYVLMDRSFWATDVFAYLQRARYPFLLPVLARGKRPTAPGGATGTQRFVHGRCRSGFYRYQVRNHRGQAATLTIVVHRRNRGGRRGRHGRYAWAYGLWRVQLASVVWVRESYRRRFRIESSYRLLEQGRGRTSSRDAGVRLWYVLLGLLLANQWLQLRREVARADVVAPCWANHLLAALVQVLWTLTAEAASQPDQRE